MGTFKETLGWKWGGNNGAVPGWRQLVAGDLGGSTQVKAEGLYRTYGDNDKAEEAQKGKTG